MEKLFQTNLQLLEKFQPALLPLLDIQADDSSLENTSEGYDLKINKSLRYLGKPQEMASEALKDADIYRPKIILMYGLGLGYTLQKLLSEITADTRHILIIEKSPMLLRNSLSVIEWDSIASDSRIKFLIGATEEIEFLDFFSGLVRSEDSLYLKSMAVVLEPGLSEDEEEYYERAAKALHQEVKRSSYYLNVPPEDTYYGFLNTFNNLSEAHEIPLFDPLENQFHDVPGILISTGPSLPKNFEWIRKMQNKAIIACCDSALKIVLSEGITPHFVGCLERVPETRLFFDQLPPLPNTYFLACPIVSPQTFKVYPGPKINMMRGLAQLDWMYPEANKYFTGNSVSHLLYIALQKMGCSSIFLTGQDLAYDRHSDKTHAAAMPELLEKINASSRNSDIEKMQKEGISSSLMVIGNNEVPILTSYWLNRFREIFNDILRGSPIKTYNVIPANYGAKLESVDRIDPENAESLIPDQSVDLSARISSLLKPCPWDKTLLKERVEIAKKYLKQYQNKAQAILHETEVMRQNLILHLEESPQAYRDFFVKVEKELKKIHSDEDGFFNSFFLCQVRHVTKPIAMQAQATMNKADELTDMTLQKLSAIYGWFSTIQFWSSRMLWFLENELGQTVK